MSFIKNIKEGITRNIVFIGMVSFFMDISSEMIFSILPLFLSNVIGASAPVIGLIEGIAESTAAILKFVSGWLSDKFGRRKLFMYIGYGLSTLCKPFFAIAGTWPVVLFARFSDRLGKGIRGTARDALLAESSKRRYRGKIFGMHRAMDTAGAVIGPLLALLLFSYLGYRGVFWIAVIPAVLAVLMIIPIKVKEKYEEDGFSGSQAKLSLRGFDSRYKRFVFVISLFSLANFSYAFFILRSQNVGASPEYAIILYLIFNATYLLLAMPAGMLSDRIGRKNTIMIGFMIFTLIMLGFSMASTLAHAFILFMLYGAFMSIFEGVPRAFVSDLVGDKRRGTALGILNGITGMMILPASFLAGMIWQYVNPAAPFFIGAGISVLSLILMLFMV